MKKWEIFESYMHDSAKMLVFLSLTLKMSSSLMLICKDNLDAHVFLSLKTYDSFPDFPV